MISRWESLTESGDTDAKVITIDDHSLENKVYSFCKLRSKKSKSIKLFENRQTFLIIRNMDTIGYLFTSNKISVFVAIGEITGHYDNCSTTDATPTPYHHIVM